MHLPTLPLIRAPLLPLLLRLVGADAAPALSDHAALVQVGAASALVHVQAAGAVGGRLAVFFDGTSMSHEGNLFKLYNGLVNDANRSQLTHYEPGVQDELGHGVRLKGLDGLAFLSRSYRPGDQIFIYGSSRGCMSGRYLQGLIAEHGIPKAPIDGLPLARPDIVEAILRGSEAWRDVDVQVLGCIDGVLRTLVRDGEVVEDMAYMHQQIRPSVRNFLHALATDEAKAFIFVAEVLVPEETHEEQVWFGAEHISIVMDHEVVIGWLAERSQELGGLLLKDGFLESLDYCVTCNGPRPLLNGITIRNPMACRKELYGNRRVKLHASISDRMAAVKGWAPLTTCCHPDALNETGGVEWVATPAYEAHRRKVRPAPQWIRVAARFANITEEDLRDESLHLILQTPYGSRYMAGVAEHKKRLSRNGSAVFEEALAYPSHGEKYYVAGAVGPCKSIVECTWNSLNYDGMDFRILEQLTLDAETPTKSDVSFVWGKIQVSVDFLYDDDAAGRVMNTAGPRCAWVGQFSDPPTDICEAHEIDYPVACDALREQATDGDWKPSGASTMVVTWALLLAPLLVLIEGSQ